MPKKKTSLITTQSTGKKKVVIIKKWRKNDDLLQELLFEQTKPQLKSQYKLSQSQKDLLGILILNPNMRVSRNILYKCSAVKYPQITITRFLKKAESLGIIKRCKIKKGKIINNLFQFHKGKPTFEDGDPVPNHNAVYYTLTELGKEVHKVNK